MALFQQSVLKQYINNLDKVAVQAAYEKFKAHFGNTTIQQNIRDAKEEQYQEGFLRELFGEVLGYTLNPQPNYNLTTELKNEKGAKKADGAILQADKAIAVIELKGTNTTDLSKIEVQAFSYKNNQTSCVYVITSNFERLRFYIDNAIEYEEFNLFALTPERFSLLYLCLAKENLLIGLPADMKRASVAQEENITKKLYADYSFFKRSLYENIVALNPAYDKLLLFKKTQKLLDRFLFIFFAEDKQLLPPNSIREILNQWTKLKELDSYTPLYERFKKYFGYLNTGYKGTKHEIFAYNGGLFAPDEVLDNITIDDNILHQHTTRLSNYDFETEVDVNILGHIFEHSLNEIDAITAQIQGNELDNKTTKRKKDGVFYTPKYITKYIVENTVGRLCAEKRQEFEIDDEELFEKAKRKDAKKQLIARVDAYRDWLLTITICDPACGSGAFLNQALDFLIEEHRKLDVLKARLLGGAIVFSDIENEILEHNIFGVDINEEAVEIARLSLWLRTARKGRKLNSLNNNIKCGNSLIDDPAVAGEKAFDWFAEFPQVFPRYKHKIKEETKNTEIQAVSGDSLGEFKDDAHGLYNEFHEPPAPYTYKPDSKGFEKHGFNIIIGNPPWGATLNKVSEEHLIKKFPLVPTKLKDSYMFFMLLAIRLLSKNGLYGLIVPNTWLLINSTKDFRKELLGFKLQKIIDHGDAVFIDAIVESSTIILQNIKNMDSEVNAIRYKKGVEVLNHQVDKRIWLEDSLHRIVLELEEKKYQIIQKLERIAPPFSTFSEIIFGIKPYQVGHGIPVQTREMVDLRIYHSEAKADDQWKPLLVGTDIKRYTINYSSNSYIKYGKWLMYASDEEKIGDDKILLRRTSHDLKASLDSHKYYPQNSIFIITSTFKLKYLLALLNSKLFDFVYKTKCPQEGKIFAEVKPSIIKSLPVKEVDERVQESYSLKVDIILKHQELFQTVLINFLRLLQSKYPLILTQKLENWPTLDFVSFAKELGKQKMQLPFAEQAEWLSYFETEKGKAQQIQKIINNTDKEIDKMVYKLYELTYDEVKIIEPDCTFNENEYNSFSILW